MGSLVGRNIGFGKEYFSPVGKGINKNVENKGHNCNLCKNTKIFPQIGNVCIGDKRKGKIIDADNKICEEYEFGGFIELRESIYRLR